MGAVCGCRMGAMLRARSLLLVVLPPLAAYAGWSPAPQPLRSPLRYRPVAAPPIPG